MGGFLRDLRLAVRKLLHNPGFVATVVVTLALAIGANTAVFSIMNALFVRNLPYPEPERLGTILMRVEGTEPSDFRNDIDGEQWELLRDNVPSLVAAISGDGTSGVNLRAGQLIQYVHAGRISAHYLDVLGLRPSLGRNFTEDEDRGGGSKAVILSYGLWKMAFGGDANLVGQSIFLKGEPHTVVGVLPKGATTPENADIYTALRPSRSGEGGGTNYEVIVRLRPGATWQQADAELNRAWAVRTAGFDKSHPGSRVRYNTVPLQQGQAAWVRGRVLTLMLAAGAILLIACANLAGLTLVRMARRWPEMATRLALGASHWQVQKQLWVENLLLALLGGLFGVGVGYVAPRGLLSLLPEGYLPVAKVPLDLRVLGFTIAVAVATSVLFGMLPAFTLARLDLRTGLARKGTAESSRLRLRQTLIAVEVALTVVLLTGAGLLIRTLMYLETLPPGFNPNGVMTAKASLADARYYDPVAFTKLLSESTAALRRIPGVQNAAVGLTLPYERALNDGVDLHDGPQAGHSVGTDVVYVTAGYFETLEMPLLAGRTITDADGRHVQPVAVINQTFARKFFPEMNPIGRTVNKQVVIVGVVADTQIASGLNPTAPLQSEETIYIPAAQVEPGYLQVVHIWFQPSWIVRTAHPIEGLTVQMQRALAETDPGLPFSGFYRLSDLEARTLSSQRVEVALLGVMAGLALLLSLVGIFGLVASLVAERTREIGIRMALGSGMGSAIRHVASSGLRASFVGLAVGLLLSLAVLRAMRSVIYGVGVYDERTLLSVTLGLSVAAILASTAPALRVARIDPARTLRDE
jgi:predicted permease